MKINYIEANRHPGGKTRLTVIVDTEIEPIIDIVGKARNHPYDLKLVPHKDARSIEANAYYQVLLDTLAGALGSSRDEVHELMLGRYGVTKTDKDGDPIVFPTRPDKDGHRQARYCEVIKEGNLNGKPCIWWRELKGSSEMNTAEFSHLIDGVISELNEMGVTVPERNI